MFARKVKDRSGSISVQVIHKDQGRYRVVKTVGTSKNPEQVERFWQQAQHFIHHPDPKQEKLFSLENLIEPVQRILFINKSGYYFCLS
jgi:hypothetical protein